MNIVGRVIGRGNFEGVWTGNLVLRLLRCESHVHFEGRLMLIPSQCGLAIQQTMGNTLCDPRKAPTQLTLTAKQKSGVGGFIINFSDDTTEQPFNLNTRINIKHLKSNLNQSYNY